MSDDMELAGLDELIKKLEDMGKAGEKIENKALKRAGKVILGEAKENVPYYIIKCLDLNMVEGNKIEC